MRWRQLCSRTPDDEAARLVRRAKRGEHPAFEELVRRYRGRIYALALQLTGSASEADDVTQEAFLSAYRHIQAFEGRSEFFTWLYRIALNRSLNAERDRRRRAGVNLEDPRVEAAVAVDACGSPARAAELRQTYARLVCALDALSPTLRATVVLVALQGLSHGEAAVVLGCTAGTVGWRMHEARDKLTRALATIPAWPSTGAWTADAPVVESAVGQERSRSPSRKSAISAAASTGLRCSTR